MRLHTKRLKENADSVQNRKKTPGEKLVEKFLIRDKVSEETKRKKLKEEEEAEARRLKHAHKDRGLCEAEDKVVKNEEFTTSRRKSIQDCLHELEGLIDPDEPARHVLKVTQPEALDVLVLQKEDETATKLELAADPASANCESVKDKQTKSNTAKKRQKKKDKGSTIKRANGNPAEVSSKPIEKSLLQRRNTVKKLRRNSRDLELLTLDISGGHLENGASVGSACSALTASPCSSVTATISTSVDSTPDIEPVPLEVRTSVVPKAQCSSREGTGSLETKVRDAKFESDISKKASVDNSLENGDVFKKSPLRFVVDEITVEETPKLPKSFRFEVTVEEICDEELPFQKHKCTERSDVSSSVENVRQDGSDEVFWNTEDAEAHKLSNLIKNVSKCNENKDCFYIPKSTENTFPSTYTETQNKQEKVKHINNKDSVEQKLKFPNLKENQNKNMTKIKGDIKTIAVTKKENENRDKLCHLEQKRNETNEQKKVKHVAHSEAGKTEKKCRCEVTVGMFVTEMPKTPLITQFICKSQERKFGQYLASYPKWDQKLYDCASELRTILEEGGHTLGRQEQLPTMNCEQKPPEDVTKSDSPFASNRMGKDDKYGEIHARQKAETVSKIHLDTEVIPKRKVDNNKVKQVEEKEKGKPTLTATYKMSSHTGGGSKLAEDISKDDKSTFRVPETEGKSFPIKPQLKKEAQNKKDTKLTNKVTTDKEGPEIHGIEKDTWNGMLKERNSSSQVPESTAAIGQRNEQSHISAQDSCDLQQESEQVWLVQNESSPIVSSTNGAAENIKPATKNESLLQETEAKAKSHSDKSEPGTKRRVQETKGKEAEKQKSDEAGQKVKGAIQNVKKAAADLHVNKRMEKAEELKLLKSKLKSVEPLTAEKAKISGSKLESAIQKSAEKTKPTEAKLGESKLKFSDAKITDSKLGSPQASPVQNSEPHKVNFTESKTDCPTADKMKPLASKLTHVETSPVGERVDTTKSPIKETESATAPPEMKSIDKKTDATGKSAAKETKSTEIENPTEEAEQKLLEHELSSDSTPEGTSPLGKKTEREPPERKLTPMKAKILSHPKASGTPEVEKGKSSVTSAAGVATAMETSSAPHPAATVEEESSSEDETDSEEETETDDDGEERKAPAPSKIPDLIASPL